MTCPTCNTKRAMEFECIDCCVRWLSGMDRETMAINAPVIEKVMGAEHLEKVRQAFKKEWGMK